MGSLSPLPRVLKGRRNEVDADDREAQRCVSQKFPRISECVGGETVNRNLDARPRQPEAPSVDLEQAKIDKTFQALLPNCISLTSAEWPKKVHPDDRLRQTRRLDLRQRK